MLRIYKNYFYSRLTLKMATANNNIVTPDHIIIWLDRNMCVPENNKSSKKILNNNANVNHLEPDPELSEINRLICLIDPELNEDRFENLIRSPLRLFTDKDECIKCIHDNIEAQKKIFLITSGQMGALIVGDVHRLLSGCIYVFCAQRHLHETWTKPYENDIEIYDDEKGVFAKVLADIAIYYLIRGQENGTENPTAAIQYLRWAKQLFKRATKIDHIQRNGYLTILDKELTALQSDGHPNDFPVQPYDERD